MWMDVIKFIIERLYSILSTFTIIFLIILLLKSKGYSKKEINRKILSFLKLYIIFTAIIVLLIVFINSIYYYIL